MKIRHSLLAMAMIASTVYAREVTVTNDMVVTHTSDLQGCDVTISNEEYAASAGTLTIDAGNGTLRLSSLTMNVDYFTYFSSFDSDTFEILQWLNQMSQLLVKQTRVEAGSVSIALTESGETSKWTYFSLPFDAWISQVDAGDAGWMVRRYDSEVRASGKGSAWVNVKPDEMLHAHQGYILTREHSDYHEQKVELPDGWENWTTEEWLEWVQEHQNDETSTFEDIWTPIIFHAAETAHKQDIFATQDAVIQLEMHPADMEIDANWNYVANPYPCNYQLRGIEEDVILTICHESNYIAYSTADDEDQMLAPLQPFFVQALYNVESLHLSQGARTVERAFLPYDAPRRNAPRRSAAADRQVMNLLLSDGQRTDRLRLVDNPQATTAYEINRDASKMMSDRRDIPQLYAIDQGMQLAIDERPLDGCEIALGLQIGSDTEHTLHLEKADGRLTLLLTDRVTGQQIDLGKEDYHFTAMPGQLRSRFIVEIADPDATRIIEVNAPAEDPQPCYDLMGRRCTKAQGLRVQGGMVLRPR